MYNTYFIEYLQWLLLETGIHGNRKFLEGNPVLRSLKDDLWRVFLRGLLAL